MKSPRWRFQFGPCYRSFRLAKCSCFSPRGGDPFGFRGCNLALECDTVHGDRVHCGHVANVVDGLDLGGIRLTQTQQVLVNYQSALRRGLLSDGFLRCCCWGSFDTMTEGKS